MQYKIHILLGHLANQNAVMRIQMCEDITSFSS
jgi:hypothetical protein